MPKKIEIVEMPADLCDSMAVENIYEVPKRAWRNWNKQARFIFNSVMTQMSDQRVVKHPKQEMQADPFWFTIRWNSSWLSAEAAMKSIKKP